MLEVADLARAKGIDVEQNVAGSTPTGRSLAEVDGITEVVAGTYPFCDAGMGDLGVVAYDDVAVSIYEEIDSGTLEKKQVEEKKKSWWRRMFKRD